MGKMTLTAKSLGRNSAHARILFYQNGAMAGCITIEAPFEAQVLGGINGLPKLLEAARQAITFIGATGIGQQHKPIEAVVKNMPTNARDMVDVLLAAVQEVEGRA